MSRGLGQTQRRILDHLAAVDKEATTYRGPRGALGGWVPVRVLATAVYGDDPTRSQVETVRRAVKTLEARGLVALWWFSVLVPTTRGDVYRETVDTRQLAARIPALTDADLEALRQAEERRRQEWAALIQRVRAGEPAKPASV